MSEPLNVPEKFTELRRCMDEACELTPLARAEHAAWMAESMAAASNEELERLRELWSRSSAISRR